MSDWTLFCGNNGVLGVARPGSLHIGGRPVGDLVGQPTVITHDPPTRENVGVNPPTQLSVRFTAEPVNKDAIDALALAFAELSPAAEKAAVACRDFAAKLRNIQFHTDGNECPGNRAFLEANRLMHLLFTEDRDLTMNDVNRVRKMMGMRQMSAAEWEAV